MPLSPEERAARARQRMLDKAREWRPHRYRAKYVAPVFQRMIRAEAGARTGLVWSIRDGVMGKFPSPLGFCVCVTCSLVLPWSNPKSLGIQCMDAGHFLPGRRASVIFEETGVNPQCNACNDLGGGMRSEYEKWMIHVHGQEEVDRLVQLRNTVSVTHCLEDLVDWRIEYQERLKVAEGVIANG